MSLIYATLFVTYFRAKSNGLQLPDYAEHPVTTNSVSTLPQFFSQHTLRREMKNQGIYVGLQLGALFKYSCADASDFLDRHIETEYRFQK
ncbi:MAG: hypothetical protein PHI96_01120 [Desulfovibrio sp.]|nr:hypothetical protein [Desulfovibrio sp.]